MKSFFLNAKNVGVKDRIIFLSKCRLSAGGIVLLLWTIPLFKQELINSLYPISFLFLFIFFVLVYLQAKQKSFLEYLNYRANLEKRITFFKDKKANSEYTEAKSDLQGYQISTNPLWEDLDIFKDRSLFDFLNITKNTNAGQKIIQLLDSAKLEISNLIENQNKVKFLSTSKGNRKILLALLWSITDKMSLENIDLLLKKELVRKANLKYLIYFFYLLLWGLYLATVIFAAKPFYILGWIGLLIMFPLVGSHIKIMESYPWVNSFDSQIKRLKTSSKYLKRLATKAQNKNINLMKSFRHTGDSSEFDSSVNELNLIISCLGVRQNFIIYGIIHALLPWDFYWTLRLEKLKVKLNVNYKKWIADLAEIECFSQIAELSDSLENSCWPEFNSSGNAIMAKNVIHPLMSHMGARKAVPNSIELEASKKQLLIITGSNMAGKSTFLRTLAMNQLLAQIGSKVTAESFKTSAYTILTSLKRTDSLEDAFSTFYSEVKNLKWILETARVQPSLYFIDEIFRGTNNKERLIGSQKYIEQILKTTSLGLITSHDLELSQMANDYPMIFNEHFADRVEGNKMIFDYLKKAGPCPTTNALKVMELEGLFTFAPST